MVARRAHNPEVVWFKSHLRNQKRNSIRMDAVLFCLRSPNAEPPPSRPCGSDGIAPHQTNGLAHISARSGGYKSHLRNQKRNSIRMDAVPFLLTKSERRTTSEPPLRVGWDRAAPNKRPRTHFRAIRWLQVPPPQPKNFSDEVREGFTFSRNLTSFRDVAFFLQAKSHFK